jgi:hypothetical protein
MMNLRASTATFVLLLAGAARAALPIELEVAAQADAPFGSMQEWNKVLAEMDLARVRLRGANGGDRVQLRVTGDGARKRYIVTGLLDRQDQLVLPGGKFASGDLAGLKQYFETLPARHEEAGIERGRFGLTKEQFEQVFGDLSSEVTEATLDGSPHELVPALTRKFELPVRGSSVTQAMLHAAPPFRSQMKGLSTGTTLAAVLRAAGLQFVPKKLGADPLTLRVSKLDAAAECWPVGWKPLATPRQTAPAMYRVTNIEIENFTLDKALAALAPHMAVPLVLDQYTLAERKIDPTKIHARIPRTKTFVRHAVDGMLARGKLAGELRVDDAGQPFYWITQFGKDSPRATEIAHASAPQ